MFGGQGALILRSKSTTLITSAQANIISSQLSIILLVIPIIFIVYLFLGSLT